MSLDVGLNSLELLVIARIRTLNDEVDELDWDPGESGQNANFGEENLIHVARLEVRLQQDDGHEVRHCSR